MKKTLSVLSAVGISAIAGTSVVSCIAPAYVPGDPGQRVVLVTESGRVNDHAFNEDAFVGLNQYLFNEYHLNGHQSYVEPADASYTAITAGYRLAKLKKADALVLPGFSHVNVLGQAAKLFTDKSVVLIDGAPADPTDPLYKNIISIVFNSQIAGMAATFDAAYWATTINPATGKMNGDINGDNQIRIAPFGGTSFKYAVDNYLWGSFLGMELFNQYYQDKEPHRKVYLANTSTKDHPGTVEELKITSASDPAYYSGSFQLGGATKANIIASLVDDKKGDIIFPLAGAQIEDALAYRPRTTKNLPYIIGADVDQATAYNGPTNHGRFITSATKNIHQATVEALKRSVSLKDQNNQQLINRDPKDCWDGTSPRPFINWSVDLTDSKTPEGDWLGNYQLKSHQLYLYDNQDNSDDARASRLPDETTPLINFVIEAFNQTGPAIQDYMNGKLIQKVAQEIITLSQKNQFPLVHHS